MAETASQPIPFGTGEAAGLDPLSGLQPLLRNFLVDAAQAMHQRPGIRDWEDFPAASATGSPVIGIFQWDLTGWVVFVCEDRTIWAVQAPGLVVQLSTADPLTQLDGTGRPIFAYDQDRMVITGGGAIQQILPIGTSSRLNAAALSPSGSPLTATHIAYAAQRFIVNVNDRSGTLQWTPPGPGSHTSWPLVGPYWSEAEAAPDPVIAVWANTNEVFAFGTETTQVYSPDPSIAFTVAASLQTGCGAAYSVIELEDGSFAWLDNQRRFVLSNGRGQQVISSPTMDAEIKRLEDIADCWSANVMIGSWDLLLWVFHVEQRAFWFDRGTKKWGEWSSLDSNGELQPWIAQCHYYWNERNVHLVGLADGRIAELTFEAHTDDVYPLAAESETGFQDRGTFVRKLCQRVQLQLRRGETVPPDVAPVVELRYRDDLGNWKQALRFSMGAAEYQPIVDAWSLGMYRQRQWKLSYSGGGSFTLAGATETFTTGDT